jgi:DNA-binding response OmpR family regulator
MANKKVVWIVEDDPAILEVTQIVLENAGYSVIGFHAEAALFSSLGKEENPDILLLDLFVSGSDGREVSKKVQKITTGNEFPIIFMSADTNIEAKVIEGNAQGYIKKPFNIDELVAVVEKYTSMKVESRK